MHRKSCGQTEDSSACAPANVLTSRKEKSRGGPDSGCSALQADGLAEREASRELLAAALCEAVPVARTAPGEPGCLMLATRRCFLASVAVPVMALN